MKGSIYFAILQGYAIFETGLYSKYVELAIQFKADLKWFYIYQHEIVHVKHVNLYIQRTIQVLSEKFKPAFLVIPILPRTES